MTEAHNRPLFSSSRVNGLQSMLSNSVCPFLYRDLIMEDDVFYLHNSFANASMDPFQRTFSVISNIFPSSQIAARVIFKKI